MSDIYIAYGRPCAEAFQRHDIMDPRERHEARWNILLHTDHMGRWHDKLYGRRDIKRVHLIRGWYGTATTVGRVMSQYTYLLHLQAVHGFEIVERDEREIGMPEPGRDLYPWQHQRYNGEDCIWINGDRIDVTDIEMNFDVERDPFEIIRLIGHMNMMRGKDEPVIRYHEPRRLGKDLL